MQRNKFVLKYSPATKIFLESLLFSRTVEGAEIKWNDYFIIVKQVNHITMDMVTNNNCYFKRDIKS